LRYRTPCLLAAGQHTDQPLIPGRQPTGYQNQHSRAVGIYVGRRTQINGNLRCLLGSLRREPIEETITGHCIQPIFGCQDQAHDDVAVSLGFEEPANVILQCLEVAQLQVDHGEAYVGHGVQFPQVFQDQTAHYIALNLRPSQAGQILLKAIYHVLYGSLRDGAFGSSSQNAVHQLLSIVGLASAVALDDKQRGSYVLVGCKATATPLALAPATDSITGGPGVDNSRVIISAMRAYHVIG
jgi:hypothetical protein